MRNVFRGWLNTWFPEVEPCEEVLHYGWTYHTSCSPACCFLYVDKNVTTQLSAFANMLGPLGHYKLYPSRTAS